MEAHEVIEPVEVWVKVVMGGWIFKAKAQRRSLGQKVFKKCVLNL